MYSQMRCLGGLGVPRRNESNEGLDARLTLLYQFDPWLLDSGVDSKSKCGSDPGSPLAKSAVDTWHGGQQVRSTDAGDEVVEVVVGEKFSNVLYGGFCIVNILGH
jgi:hypothetical protein